MLVGDFSSSVVSGSMSTVSSEENMVLSSEDSSCPDDSELELGLGLSLSGGGFRGNHGSSRLTQYARILTAKDFPSAGSSSSSSSSSLSRVNVTSGTKRTADSAAANGAGGQVVGWPPIRAYRMNSMVNQAKTVATEELNSTDEKNRNKINMVEKNGNNKVRTSMFVKVNMDGIAIGRKVDLNAHGCYQTLAQILEDMFLNPPTTFNAMRSSNQEHSKIIGNRPAKLLGGSSDFVLTYEDKDGDWMLVGDVPWGMFLSSVKRLKIMKTSEATGLAPRLQERNGRHKSNAE